MQMLTGNKGLLLKNTESAEYLFLFKEIKMWKDDFCVSYIQSHRLLGPGLLHLVVHDGVVDAQPAKDHKRLKKTRRMQ